MSAGGAFGGNRGARPVPPEKGVFPLDHMHLCDLEKKDYIGCLKSTGHNSEKCRQFSKKYLECRMEKFRFYESWSERWDCLAALQNKRIRISDATGFVNFCRNLMAKQDMSELGFRKEDELQAPADGQINK